MSGIWSFIWRVETLWLVLRLLYVPTCIGLITLVLLQKGKGVGFAGAFGLGPGSDAVFGPRGSKSVPVRLTQIMFGLFIGLALIMSLVAPDVGKGKAPDLVEEDALDLESELTGLDDLGILPAVPEDEGKEAPRTGDVTPTPEQASTMEIVIEDQPAAEAPEETPGDAEPTP